MYCVYSNCPICIPPGWVMGCVKDRYLKYESSGDQYFGCCANWADKNSAKFAASPLHFDFSYFEMDDHIARKKKLDEFLYYCIYQLTNDADDGHAKYPAKMLFDSLWHHNDYPEENIHPESLLRNYKLFR